MLNILHVFFYNKKNIIKCNRNKYNGNVSRYSYTECQLVTMKLIDYLDRLSIERFSQLIQFQCNISLITLANVLITHETSSERNIS